MLLFCPLVWKPGYCTSRKLTSVHHVYIKHSALLPSGVEALVVHRQKADHHPPVVRKTQCCAALCCSTAVAASARRCLWIFQSEPVPLQYPPLPQDVLSPSSVGSCPPAMIFCFRYFGLRTPEQDYIYQGLIDSHLLHACSSHSQATGDPCSFHDCRLVKEA